MGIIKVIEIMADSEKSWEDATKNAVEEAAKSIKNIKSAWVQDMSTTIKDNKIKAYRVNVKISFEVKR